MNDWVKLGVISVDAGAVAICSPESVISSESNWDDYCHTASKYWEKDTRISKPWPGLIHIGTPYGDGGYTVEGRYITDERGDRVIAEARVVFIRGQQ